MKCHLVSSKRGQRGCRFDQGSIFLSVCIILICSQALNKVARLDFFGGDTSQV